ncbi:MAG: DUF1552 domain-containing protein [Sandaracinaceae bacterium]
MSKNEKTRDPRGVIDRKASGRKVSGRSRLHRRALLRGAAGVAVALPVLECMLDDNGENVARADSSGLPCRYGILFGGMALGGDSWAEDSYRIDGTNHTETGHFIAPATEGAGYALTTPLLALQGYENDFSIVTGLAIPFDRTSTDGAMVPPGGAYRDFHGGGASPLLSGVRSTDPAFMANGPTSDQIIAQLNAGQTRDPYFVARAQVPFYLTGYDHSGRQYISYTEGGRTGRVEAQTSPQGAFMSLFGTFTPDDSGAQARLDFELRSRRSVLDLILDKRQRVLDSVGAADRVRLDRHFEEIRALERRLASTPPTVTGSCQVPADPGPDPTLGPDNPGSGSADITSPSTGYSGEHERSRIFCDLIHMAFVCDLTRAANLQITAFQSHMSVLPISQGMTRPASMGGGTFDFRADLHELGHNGDANNRGQYPSALMQQWHLSHYAYLIDKLRSTPEGGGTVLDNTSLVFMFEAGHGLQLNDASSPDATHSVENMALLVAGRAGGLRPGRHIRATGRHPGSVLISAMQAAGYPQDTFGEVSGALTELF